MKTRAFVSLLILVLAVLIIAESCATRKIAISDEDLSAAYTGTWINPEEDYFMRMAPLKLVYFPDGTWNRYFEVDDDRIEEKGEDTIIAQWKDSKGTIYFESHWKEFIHGWDGYLLARISDSGNTLELLITMQEHRVEEWDRDNIFCEYRIYYRQE